MVWRAHVDKVNVNAHYKCLVEDQATGCTGHSRPFNLLDHIGDETESFHNHHGDHQSIAPSAIGVCFQGEWQQ